MLMESIEAIAESAQPAQAEAHSPTAIDMKQESPSLVTDLGETSPFPLKRPRDSSADDPDSESKRLKLDKIDDDESTAVVDIDMAAILGGVMMEMEQEIGKVDGLDSVADIDLSGDPLASVSQEPSSSHDSHPAALSEPLSLMRRTTTSCLSNFAMQLLVILSQHAYNDVYMQLQEKDSEICKSFVAIKALFQQTRAIYSTTDLILNPATLDLTEPDHLTDIQVANLASFCCALFSFDGHHDSSATELLALQDHFFSVFLPGGEEDTVTHEISELFVAVKTHLVIDAVTNADQSAAPVDQLIAEAFSVDWEDKLRARHGGTELMIEEQALIAALQKRKTDLISYASGLPDTVLLKIGFGDEELFRLLNLCLRRKLQSLAGLAARHSIKIPSMLTNGDLVSPMPHELDLAHLFSVADNLADQYLPDSAEPLDGLSDGLSADPAPVPTTENSSLPPPEPIMSAPEPAPAPVSEAAPVPAPVPETAPAPSPTPAPAPAPALAPAPSPTANGTTNGMTNGMTNGTTHGMTNGMTNDTTNVTTTTEAQDSNDILALVAQSTREYVEKTLNNLSPAPYQPTVPTPTGAAPAAQTTYLSHLQQTQAQSPYYGYPQQVEQPPQPAIHESAEKLPPRQSLPSAVLYDRARQAALSKSNNQQRREGNTSTRRPWSQEEERALMTGLDMVQGPHWSQILSLFGPEGTLSQILKDRTQVQLKDKARNLKLFFLKTNSEMPYYLQAVTGELKTRAPTQAARKEAEERARMNSEEEQARVQGIMTLASGLQHPQHSRANVPSANGGHAVLQPAAQISHHMAAQHPAAAQHGAVNGQPAASADTTPTHHRVPASSPYAATAQQLSQTPHALAHTPAHSPTQHHMQHPSHPGTPQPNHQQHHQQQHPHQQQQQQQPQQQQAPHQQHQEHAQPPASQPAEAAPQYAADASAPAYSQENDDLKEAALLRELEAYSDNAIIS